MLRPALSCLALFLVACGGESTLIDPAPPPPPPPPPSGGWLPVVDLNGGRVYSGIAATGQTVVAATGDGTVFASTSSNEGATFAPFVAQGDGTLYLEHPIAISGQSVGIASVTVSATITDFVGPRQVGDIFVRRSINGGQSFSAPVRATSGKRALRLSLAISGATWHLVYMTWRGSTWDVEYARSVDDGVSWAAPVVIANGTNGVGAGRPSLAVVGSRVFVAMMDARDNLPPCALEGGAVIPTCTEVYVVVSNDNGGTWTVPRRLTSDVAYSGRPDIVALGDVVAIVYDHRAAGGNGNDIGLLVSQDAGATWNQSLLVVAPNDQTHAMLAASATRGFHAAWMDFRNGSSHIWAKRSADAVTWGGEEQVSLEGGAGAPSLGLTDSYLHASWGESSMKYRRKLFR